MRSINEITRNERHNKNSFTLFVKIDNRPTIAGLQIPTISSRGAGSLGNVAYDESKTGEHMELGHTLRRPQRFVQAGIVALLAAGALGLMPGGAGSPAAALAATPIAVTTTADELNADGDCSLREAIQAANANAAVDACPAGSGADTITLAAGTYTLALAGAPEDANASGDLDITETLTISGAGAATTSVDANRLDRALHAIGAAALTLEDLTVENGLRGPGQPGGGIRTDAALTLNRTVLKGNTVTGSTYGGAIFAAGPVSVADSLFVGNRSDDRAPGLYAQAGATLTNTEFRDNTAPSAGHGGAAFLWGTVVINGGAFVNNRSSWTGALVVNGSLTMSGTRFIRNTAQNIGAGALQLNGPGTITNTVFGGNQSPGTNGQIQITSGAVTIVHSTIAQPAASANAGVQIEDGSLNLRSSIVAGHAVGIRQLNTATAGGDYNLFFGNTADTAGSVTVGANDRSGDPRFWGPICDNYKLGPGSAAIDAGTNEGVAVDFEGDARPLLGGFDMGFDEAVAASFEVPILCLSAANDGPTALGSPTALTAAIGGGTNVTYAWDFGDGQSGSGAAASHTYAAPGSYVATVTATNSLGNATATTTVVVRDQAIAGLTAASDGPTILGQPTQLTAAITAGTNVTYAWDFGDGQTGTGATPSHTYAAAGAYLATVTASNSAGSRAASVAVVVDPVRITSAPPPSATYGAAYSHTFAAGGPAPITWGLASGTLPPGLTLDLATGALSGTPTTPGSYTFTVRASNTAGAATQVVTIVVAKAALAVTADDLSKVYGAANPTLTFQVSGLAPGDTAASALTGALATDATATSAAGTYTITQGTLAAANYSLSFTGGTLTVTRAPLTATAEGKIRRVGQVNPPLTIAYSGFVLGQDASVLDVAPVASTEATPASAPGTYAITVAGGSDDNYQLTYVAGTLTVTDKEIPVIAWANPAAITYGTVLGTAQLNAAATVNGQPLAGSFSYDPPAGTRLNAGTGQLLKVTFTPADGANYAVVEKQVQIDVSRAPLTITAEDKSMLAGEALPALTARYSGFVYGETTAALDTPASLSTAATSASPPGFYAITVTGATDANYTITFVPGTLTVRSAGPVLRPKIYLPMVRQ
jgi:CSLREA domain-containing protein